jgi:hypothetical protein
MDEWLKKIARLQGVEGACLFIHTGEILAQAGLENHLTGLPELARRFLRMTAAHKKHKLAISEIEVVWQARRIIGVAGNLFQLIVLCNPRSSLPLIRMTVNVALAELSGDKKFQKILKKRQDIRVDHLRVGDLDETEIKLIKKLQ